MPRLKTPRFNHVIHYAPDTITESVNQRFHAKVHRLSLVRGKVTIEWTIFTPIHRKKRRKPKVEKVAT